MSLIGKLAVSILGDDKDIKRAFNNIEREGRKLQRSLQKTAQSIGDVGKTMTMGLTVPLAAISGAAFKFSADFEKAMTGSIAIMGNVSEAMRKDMSDAAREVATATRFSATEAADAYYFLASAGLDAAESMEALPRVAAFAQAGNFDLATATDLLTDAQSALGLVVEDNAQNITNMNRVSDTLVAANTIANASVQEFSEALTNKAGAALRLLKKDVEEGTAVLAVYADQGNKGVGAGESLNIVLRDLQKAAIKNKAQFDKAGISVFNASGNMNNMADIVGDLENRLSGMSDEQLRSELMMLGFQDKSVSAMMALLGTSEAIRTYEQQLREAGGTTDEVSEKQISNLWDQLNLIKSEFIDNAITVGDVLVPIIKDNLLPVFRSVAERVKEVAEWFQGLDKQSQENIVKFGLLAAAIGPALIVVSKLITAASTLVPFLTAIKTAIAAISLPTIGTVAAIAALGIVAYEVYRNWDEVKNSLNAIWEVIKASVVGLVIGVKIAFENMKRAVLGAVSFMLEKLSILEKLPFGIGEKFAGLKDAVVDSAEASGEKIKELQEAAAENGERLKASTQNMGVAFSDLGGAIEKDVKGILNTLTGMGDSTEEELDEQTKATEEAAKKQTEAAEEGADAQINAYEQMALARIQTSEATKEAIEEQKKQEEMLKEAREEFEAAWTQKLAEATTSRIDKLEQEKQAALDTAEDLGADKTAIQEYYGQQQLGILAQSVAKTLEDLEDEKKRALDKAEELGLDKTTLMDFFAKKQKEILNKQAEEDKKRDEQTQKDRENFEKNWNSKLFSLTNDRLAILRKEKEDTLKEAEKIGADKEAIKLYYEQKEIDMKEEFQEQWNSKLFESTATRAEMLEKEKQDALAAAEDLGADKTAILEYYAKKEKEILEEQESFYKGHTSILDTVVGELKDTVIGYMKMARENVEQFSVSASDAIVSFVDSVASGEKTFKDAMKDIVIGFITMLEKQVIAQQLAGIAIATAQAPFSFGASLAWIPQILAAVAPALIAFEGAKAVIRALAVGGLAVDPAFALIGEGPDDEAVLPLNRNVFSQLAAGIVDQLSQFQQPQAAFAGGGGGSAIERITNADNRAVNLTLNIGNFMGDDLSIKKLARTLIPVIDSERNRVGGDK